MTVMKVFPAKVCKSILLTHKRTSHKVLPKQIYSSIEDVLYAKVKHFQKQNVLHVHFIIPITPDEDNEKHFHNFFNSIRSDIFYELNYQMAGKQSKEGYTTVHVVVCRITQNGEINTAIPFFC